MRFRLRTRPSVSSWITRCCLQWSEWRRRARQARRSCTKPLPATSAFVGCAAWAGRRLRRPVGWVPTRAEGFIADNQGRVHLPRAALALDRDGHFLALRVNTYADLGAHVSTFGAAIPSAIYSALLAGVYRTP